jgi:hypothetical protein
MGRSPLCTRDATATRLWTTDDAAEGSRVSCAGVRWDDLFADLEGQLEQILGAEEVDLAAEEERLRLGRLGLRDRLAALVGDEVAVELRDASRLALRIEALGRDWIAGVAAGGRPVALTIPIDAVAAVLPSLDRIAATLAPPDERPDALSRRLGLAFVLRDLCRRRRPVELTTVTRAVHGTIDRVGRDHLDLAEHDPGESRRPASVRAIRLVPFAQLLVVRS